MSALDTDYLVVQAHEGTTYALGGLRKRGKGYGTTWNPHVYNSAYHNSHMDIFSCDAAKDELLR